MKKFVIVALLLLALLGIGGALHQSAPAPAQAAVDSWSGHSESLIPFSQAITLNTSAVLYTGVSTVRPNIRAAVITNSASGVVTFYDGAVVQGSAVIAQFAVIANTPLYLDEDRLGVGIRAAMGDGIYVSGATGTITITARVRTGGN